MTEQQCLDLLPKLSEIELAVALNACRDAGAINAANALSKHCSRMAVEVERLRASHNAARAMLLRWRNGEVCPVDGETNAFLVATDQFPVDTQEVSK